MIFKEGDMVVCFRENSPFFDMYGIVSGVYRDNSYSVTIFKCPLSFENRENTWYFRSHEMRKATKLEKALK